MPHFQTDSDVVAAFRDAPVAALATVRPDGAPHVVPVVFAMAAGRDDLIYTAIDAKPKSTQRLRRLDNIENNPAVSLLVDHYDDDWSQLWWVRADGTATSHRQVRAVRAGAAQRSRRQHRGPPLGVVGWGLTGSGPGGAMSCSS